MIIYYIIIEKKIWTILTMNLKKLNKIENKKINL